MLLPISCASLFVSLFVSRVKNSFRVWCAKTSANACARSSAGSRHLLTRRQQDSNSSCPPVCCGVRTSGLPWGHRPLFLGGRGQARRQGAAAQLEGAQQGDGQYTTWTLHTRAEAQGYEQEQHEGHRRGRVTGGAAVCAQRKRLGEVAAARCWLTVVPLVVPVLSLVQRDACVRDECPSCVESPRAHAFTDGVARPHRHLLPTTAHTATPRSTVRRARVRQHAPHNTHRMHSNRMRATHLLIVVFHLCCCSCVCCADGMRR
jgi:hypothetical protein